MQIAIAGRSDQARRLAAALEKGGAAPVCMLSPDADIDVGADILILFDAGAVEHLSPRCAEALSHSETVLLLPPEKRYVLDAAAGLIPASRRLYFRLHWETGPDGTEIPVSFSFQPGDFHGRTGRAEQHLAICLRRAGLASELRAPAQPSRQMPAPAPKEAPAGGDSWLEMLLPACERGLPCDDCGRCH